MPCLLCADKLETFLNWRILFISNCKRLVLFFTSLFFLKIIKILCKPNNQNMNYERKIIVIHFIVFFNFLLILSILDLWKKSFKISFL